MYFLWSHVWVETFLFVIRHLDEIVISQSFLTHLHVFTFEVAVSISSENFSWVAPILWLLIGLSAFLASFFAFLFLLFFAFLFLFFFLFLGWFLLIVVEWLTLHSNILSKVFIALHAFSPLLSKLMGRHGSKQ